MTWFIVTLAHIYDVMVYSSSQFRFAQRRVVSGFSVKRRRCFLPRLPPSNGWLSDGEHEIRNGTDRGEYHSRRLTMDISFTPPRCAGGGSAASIIRIIPIAFSSWNGLVTCLMTS